ncbi:phosphoglycerate mutase [Rhodoferax sp.]|uniref:phosphoglycerate mutase n=1 Tax=Rhodoferax sp. TaxID=50421 RepID=UPI00271C7F71|nr:phosphoglycerate mutase [Rhodoferax sp.]MDO9195888.1 phosphoglycerate mutase [Rhodoferax sp.]
MHLLIPFAFCSSEGCAAALPTLKLPHLAKLLARLTPLPMDKGDEFSLSPPHERALARTLGLPAQDGLIPWAALQALNKGQPADGAWGFITPCHWQVGTNHIAMSGLELPDFSTQESQTLLAAMQPYFEEDGIALHYDHPTRWLARGDLFDGLATASLDRVVGRNVENWMPRSASAAGLRRLQNEMQMLLYTHPVNDARAARGAPPVNSFWLSGTGALPQPLPEPAEPQPVVATHLREAALNEDWAAWVQAWQALDATECVALLRALDQGGGGHQLTLCGERNAQTFDAQPQTFYKRFMNIFGTQPPSILLETL